MSTRRRERGAAAVEGALVTPLFILMLVGIIEFSMYFKDYLSTASAVRAGVRTASAEARISTYAQDAANSVAREGAAVTGQGIQELWVYKSNTNNEFPAGASSFDTGCTTCVKFSWNGTAFVPTYSNWNAITHVACKDSPPDRVGVYMKVRHDALTGFVFNSLTIKEAAVLRFEPMPVTQGCRP